MKITSRGRPHSAERSSPWCGGIGLHLLCGLGAVFGMSVDFIFYFIFLGPFFLGKFFGGKGGMKGRAFADWRVWSDSRVTVVYLPTLFNNSQNRAVKPLISFSAVKADLDVPPKKLSVSSSSEVFFWLGQANDLIVDFMTS